MNTRCVVAIFVGCLLFLSGCGSSQELQPISGTYEVNSSASSVKFTSIKNGDLAVTGKFNKVQGSVTIPSDGALSGSRGSFKLDLSSIETGLDVRNQNIVDTFFRIPSNKQFRYASFSFDSVKTQQSRLTNTNSPTEVGASGSMTLAGETVDTFVPLRVTRTGEDTLRITSRTPWVLSIKKFGLSGPLQALMEVCGHKDVSDAVPLTFDLQLTKTTS
ncbi:MAG: YceI family protein [bacterium]